MAEPLGRGKALPVEVARNLHGRRAEGEHQRRGARPQKVLELSRQAFVRLGTVVVEKAGDTGFGRPVGLRRRDLR